jgi:hypothetical protein
VNCRRLATAFLWLLFLYSPVDKTIAQTIEAHEVGTGNAVIDRWIGSWGSYNRDYLQTKRLRVTVRDVTRKLRGVELLVYFIGRRLPDGEQFIYSHNRIPVAFNGDIEVTGDIPAPQITFNQRHSGWTGRNRFHGEEIRGWIIVGREGSRIFDTRASGPDLLERAREDSQQPDSLRAMIATAHIHDDPVQTTVPPQTTPPPDAVQQPIPPVAAKSPSSPPTQFTTLLKAIPVTLPYGQATLQPGTKFQVISRSGQAVQILYGGSTITVPISSTDLK